MTKLGNLLVKSKYLFHSEVRKKLPPLSKYTGTAGDKKINLALSEHPKSPARLINLLVAHTCLQRGKPTLDGTLPLFIRYRSVLVLSRI